MSNNQNNGDKWLIFVDTNIFLDFYRAGGESAQRQLKLLEKHKGSLIISEQIWMEFLKNRQKVIVAGLKGMKKISGTSVPPIVTESQAHKMLKRQVEEANKQFGKITSNIDKVLQNPTTSDPVYKAVSRLLKINSNLNLKRPDKQRFVMRNLAKKRFILGYPPPPQKWRHLNW